MKDIVFCGRSLDAIKAFTPRARQETGYQLDKVQQGDNPTDWKPMPLIGAGVREIRITDANGIFRVIYVAHDDDAVYVLHAFQKKSQKTSLLDIEAATRAFKQLVKERQR
ncbi:MAG: type II toxin-antitoxin system RelE/ParE family toxin [Pseudomonadota bacterium]